MSILIAVYMPALNAGFIWDDDDHFTENPYVTAPDGLITIWTSTKAIYYPLTLTTWWVMRRLFDLNPFPYHLGTLLFHAANSVLLAVVLRRLVIPGAFFAGALFAFHPMQVESVAWATELKNTQSGFFFYLAILAYLRSEDRLARAERWIPAWLGSIALGAAAILSKPSTVPLGGVLLVMTIWRAGKFEPRLVLRVAPFFVLGLLSAVWTIYEQKHHSNAKGPEWDYGFIERLIIAGRAFWFYIGKFVWPDPLIFIYPRWTPVTGPGLLHLGWFLAVAGPVVLGLMLHFRPRPWAGNLLTGWLIYGGLLVPILGFFNIYFNRFSFVADHFVYLALSVPCVGVAVIFALLIERLDSGLRLFGWLAAGIILVLAGVASHRQSKIYNNEEVLWRETIRLNPSAWIAHNNLGYELARQGRFEEAISWFEQAIALKPDYEEAYNNIGFALLELGRPAESIAPLEQAILYRQPYADALLNLANAYAGVGDLNAAARVYTTVVQLLPNDAVVFANFGSIEAMRGNHANALRLFERANDLEPGNPTIVQSLTRLRAIQAGY